MRRSPLLSGFIYLILGILFIFFAIQDVQDGGWGIFPILLVLLATYDCGSGIKMILASVFRKS